MAAVDPQKRGANESLLERFLKPFLEALLKINKNCLGLQ